MNNQQQQIKDPINNATTGGNHQNININISYNLNTHKIPKALLDGSKRQRQRQRQSKRQRSRDVTKIETNALANMHQELLHTRYQQQHELSNPSCNNQQQNALGFCGKNNQDAFRGEINMVSKAKCQKQKQKRQKSKEKKKKPTSTTTTKVANSKPIKSNKSSKAKTSAALILQNNAKQVNGYFLFSNNLNKSGTGVTGANSNLPVNSNYNANPSSSSNIKPPSLSSMSKKKKRQKLHRSGCKKLQQPAPTRAQVAERAERVNTIHTQTAYLQREEDNDIEIDVENDQYQQQNEQSSPEQNNQQAKQNRRRHSDFYEFVTLQESAPQTQQNYAKLNKKALVSSLKQESTAPINDNNYYYSPLVNNGKQFKRHHQNRQKDNLGNKAQRKIKTQGSIIIPNLSSTVLKKSKKKKKLSSTSNQKHYHQHIKSVVIGAGDIVAVGNSSNNKGINVNGSNINTILHGAQNNASGTACCQRLSFNNANVTNTANMHSKNATSIGFHHNHHNHHHQASKKHSLVNGNGKTPKSNSHSDNKKVFYSSTFHKNNQKNTAVASSFPRRSQTPTSTQHPKSGSHNKSCMLYSSKKPLLFNNANHQNQIANNPASTTSQHRRRVQSAQGLRNDKKLVSKLLNMSMISQDGGLGGGSQIVSSSRRGRDGCNSDWQQSQAHLYPYHSQQQQRKLFFNSDLNNGASVTAMNNNKLLLVDELSDSRYNKRQQHGIMPQQLNHSFNKYLLQQVQTNQLQQKQRKQQQLHKQNDKDNKNVHPNNVQLQPQPQPQQQIVPPHKALRDFLSSIDMRAIKNMESDMKLRGKNVNCDPNDNSNNDKKVLATQQSNKKGQSKQQNNIIVTAPADGTTNLSSSLLEKYPVSNHLDSKISNSKPITLKSQPQSQQALQQLIPYLVNSKKISYSKLTQCVIKLQKFFRRHIKKKEKKMIEFYGDMFKNILSNSGINVEKTPLEEQDIQNNSQIFSLISANRSGVQQNSQRVMRMKKKKLQPINGMAISIDIKGEDEDDDGNSWLDKLQLPCRNQQNDDHDHDNIVGNNIFQMQSDGEVIVDPLMQTNAFHQMHKQSTKKPSYQKERFNQSSSYQQQNNKNLTFDQEDNDDERLNSSGNSGNRSGNRYGHGHGNNFIFNYNRNHNPDHNDNANNEFKLNFKRYKQLVNQQIEQREKRASAVQKPSQHNPTHHVSAVLATDNANHNDSNAKDNHSFQARAHNRSKRTATQSVMASSSLSRCYNQFMDDINCQKWGADMIEGDRNSRYPLNNQNSLSNSDNLNNFKKNKGERSAVKGQYNFHDGDNDHYNQFNSSNNNINHYDYDDHFQYEHRAALSENYRPQRKQSIQSGSGLESGSGSEKRIETHQREQQTHEPGNKPNPSTNPHPARSLSMHKEQQIQQWNNINRLLTDSLSRGRGHHRNKSGASGSSGSAMSAAGAVCSERQRNDCNKQINDEQIEQFEQQQKAMLMKYLMQQSALNKRWIEEQQEGDEIGVQQQQQKECQQKDVNKRKVQKNNCTAGVQNVANAEGVIPSSSVQGNKKKGTKNRKRKHLHNQPNDTHQQQLPQQQQVRWQYNQQQQQKQKIINDHGNNDSNADHYCDVDFGITDGNNNNIDDDDDDDNDQSSAYDSKKYTLAIDVDRELDQKEEGLQQSQTQQEKQSERDKTKSQRQRQHQKQRHQRPCSRNTNNSNINNSQSNNNNSNTQSQALPCDNIAYNNEYEYCYEDNRWVDQNDNIQQLNNDEDGNDYDSNENVNNTSPHTHITNNNYDYLDCQLTSFVKANNVNPLKQQHKQKQHREKPKNPSDQQNQFDDYDNSDIDIDQDADLDADNIDSYPDIEQHSDYSSDSAGDNHVMLLSRHRDKGRDLARDTGYSNQYQQHDKYDYDAAVDNNLLEASIKQQFERRILQANQQLRKQRQRQKQRKGRSDCNSNEDSQQHSLIELLARADPSQKKHISRILKRSTTSQKRQNSTSSVYKNIKEDADSLTSSLEIQQYDNYEGGNRNERNHQRQQQNNNRWSASLEQQYNEYGRHYDDDRNDANGDYIASRHQQQHNHHNFSVMPVLAYESGSAVGTQQQQQFRSVNSNVNNSDGLSHPNNINNVVSSHPPSPSESIAQLQRQRQRQRPQRPQRRMVIFDGIDTSFHSIQQYLSEFKKYLLSNNAVKQAMLANINKDIGPNSLEILSYLRPDYDDEEDIEAGMPLEQGMAMRQGSVVDGEVGAGEANTDYRAETNMGRNVDVDVDDCMDSDMNASGNKDENQGEIILQELKKEERKNTETAIVEMEVQIFIQPSAQKQPYKNNQKQYDVNNANKNNENSNNPNHQKQQQQSQNINQSQSQGQSKGQNKNQDQGKNTNESQPQISQSIAPPRLQMQPPPSAVHDDQDDQSQQDGLFVIPSEIFEEFQAHLETKMIIQHWQSEKQRKQKQLKEIEQQQRQLQQQGHLEQGNQPAINGQQQQHQQLLQPQPQLKLHYSERQKKLKEQIELLQSSIMHSNSSTQARAANSNPSVTAPAPTLSNRQKAFMNFWHRSMFESYNEFLDFERPYGVNGKPYDWVSERKKFRPVKQQDLANCLQTAFRKQIQAISLPSGIIYDKPDTPAIYNNLCGQDKMVLNEQRLSRMLALQLYQAEQTWLNYNDEMAELLVELSRMIEERLFFEICSEHKRLEIKRNAALSLTEVVKKQEEHQPQQQ